MELSDDRKAVLYALRLIRLRWDEDKDWRGLLATLRAVRDLGMLRLVDLLLMPGEFRETVIYMLKHGEEEED